MEFQNNHENKDETIIKMTSASAGNRKNIASAGNRTRINCLEGSYADHYTTDALMRYSMKFSQHTKIIIKIGYVIITFSIAFAAI